MGSRERVTGLPGRLTGDRKAAVAAAVVVAAVAVAPVVAKDKAVAAPHSESGLAQADPGDLEDGYRHYVVAFEGATPGAPMVPAEPGAPTPDAGPGSGTLPPGAPGPAAGRTRRWVPVEEHDGMTDAEALRAVQAEGTILSLRRNGGRLEALVDLPAGSTLDRPETGSPNRSDTGDPTTTTSGAGGDPYAEALLAVPGTKSVSVISPGSYQVVTSAGADEYRAVPGVLAVNQDVFMAATSADTWFNWQWHLENLGQTVSSVPGTPGVDAGAEEAWAVTRGEGTVVAVVDTGIEVTHPDLAPNIWRNPGEICGNGADDDHNGFVDDCNGWDFANNDNKVDDTGTNAAGQTITITHGTHIAGTIAAVAGNDLGVAGLAPGVKLMPIKASDTGSFWLSNVARGINYAVANGADVVSVSIATRPGTVSLAQIPDLVAAVQYAASRDVLVVVAAANDTVDIDLLPVWPASLADPNVITVGASDNRDAAASFSNWGATGVDLFAPGVGIVATYPNSQYGGMNGTSMATPLVAAAAALVRAANPGYDAAAVKAAVLGGTTPVAAFAGRSVTGGRLDAGAVLNPSGSLDGPAAFSFSGFAGAEAGVAQPATVSADVDPAAVPGGPHVVYEATLLTNEGGVAHGVAGAPVETAGGPAVTDADASVTLSPPGGAPAGATSLDFGFTLPAGQYALVTQAYSAADGSAVGRPSAVFFAVAAPGGDPPPPTTTTTLPNPWTSPPTTAPPPTTTTTAPNGGTTPPTVPNGGTPPTTVPSGGTTPTTAPNGGSTPTTLPNGGTSPTTAPNGGTSPTTVPNGGTTPTTGATWPTTTTAPPNPWTWPPTTTTTTTLPNPWTWPPTTTTTLPPPSHLPPPAPPVQNGTLKVTAVSPRYGSTLGGERITVTGEGFRGTMYVLFGSSPGWNVSVASPTQLLVTTPPRATEETVDLRVTISGGPSVTFTDAFTFTAPPPPTTPGPGPGPTTTTTQAGTTPTTAPNGGTTPTTAPSGGPTTTTTPGGTSPTTAPTPTTTTTWTGTVPPTAPPTTPTTAPAPSGTRFSFGPVTATRAGLQLRPVLTSPLSSMPPATWAARRCATDTCTGVRL